MRPQREETTPLRLRAMAHQRHITVRLPAGMSVEVPVRQTPKIVEEVEEERTVLHPAKEAVPCCRGVPLTPKSAVSTRGHGLRLRDVRQQDRAGR